MKEDALTYNLISIRELLVNAFTTDTLHRFCMDHQEFRPVTTDFSPAQGLGTMIDRLVEYCGRNLLLDELLIEVKSTNPRQYKQHEPYFNETRTPQPVVNLRPWDRLHTFQDRVAEENALRDYLGRKTARLICIVGPGGMGKTALACYVLADLEPKDSIHQIKVSDEAYIDGILYLSAKSTGLSLECIYTGVMQMLDEPTARRLYQQWTYPGASLPAKVGYLLAAAQGKSYIILLDNLEDCLSEDGMIAEEGLRFFIEGCLTHSTNFRLIATSRRGISLPPGSFPCVRTVRLHRGLPDDDAVSFLQNLDPDGELGLKDAPLDSLRGSSRYVRGVPLALELVAGLLNDNPSAQLNDLLADRTLFAEQVVNRLLDQVYPRLSTDELGVIQALAILDRPVNKEAISFLLQPWFPDLDIEPALRHLVQSFIVTVQRSTGEYSLHLLHWEYVDSRLPVNERSNDYNRHNLQLRAAEYYASKRKSEREWYSIEDLAPQLTEFEHRVRAGDYDGASQVLDTIEAYLYVWGYYTRLVGLRDRLLTKLTDPALQATNLRNLGEACAALGQDERAIEFYEKALTISRAIRDREREQSTLRNLASAHRNLGHDEAAIKCFGEALAIAPEGQSEEEKVRLLNDQGFILWHQESLEQAIERYQQALIVAENTRNDELQSLTLGHLGFSFHKLGQLDQALEAHSQALVVAQEIGHRQLETRHLSNIGYVHHDLGAFERAIECQCQALEIVREIGNLREESNQLDRLGNTYHSLGRFTEAAELYKDSLNMARELRNRRGESYRLLGLSRALLGLGESHMAQQHCERALLLGISGWSYYMLPLTMGTILLHQEEPAAWRYFAEAVKCSRDMLSKASRLYKAQHTVAVALVGEAVCRLTGQPGNELPKLLAPALAEYRRALDICSAPGVVHDALWNLEMIRDAGIEGLEPIFDLLKNVGNQTPSEH
jgi:tetratricopeptide (TPR) repeat protein